MERNLWEGSGALKTRHRFSLPAGFHQTKSMVYRMLHVNQLCRHIHRPCNSFWRNLPMQTDRLYVEQI